MLALSHLVVHQLHRALVLLNGLQPALPGGLGPDGVGAVETEGEVRQGATPRTDPQVVWFGLITCLPSPL
eukprot:1260352-Pyramimonas_sp.AAC.1